MDLLPLERCEFSCPWTHKTIRKGVAYDLDHLVPVKIYSINELWNLMPSDPHFNSHQKRDRMPSSEKLLGARSALVQTYTHYQSSQKVEQVMREDARLRFRELDKVSSKSEFPLRLAGSVISFIHQIAEARQLYRFSTDMSKLANPKIN